MAAFAGALLTYLVQNFLAIRNEDASHIDDHIAEIRLIENYAVEYWLADPEQDQTKEKHYRAKLEGAISASGCFNEDARRILGRRYSEYQSLDQEIFEAVTGGSFGSNEKCIDYNRVINVMTLCNKMRSLLRRSRRSQYWAH